MFGTGFELHLLIIIIMITIVFVCRNSNSLRVTHCGVKWYSQNCYFQFKTVNFQWRILWKGKFSSSFKTPNWRLNFLDLNQEHYSSYLFWIRTLCILQEPHSIFEEAYFCKFRRVSFSHVLIHEYFHPASPTKELDVTSYSKSRLKD